MRIARKLPVFVTIVTLLSIGAASFAGLMESGRVLREQAMEKLEATADGRRNEAKLYFENMLTNLRALAGVATTGEALQKFRRDWRYLGDNPKATLTERYITNNPSPPGQRADYDSARVDTYDSNHNLYHPVLRASLKRYGYSDIFLIEAKGTILYTVQKNGEFGANLADPDLKDTALAEVFRKVAESEDRDLFAMSDYVLYGPQKQARMRLSSGSRRRPSRAHLAVQRPAACSRAIATPSTISPPHHSRSEVTTGPLPPSWRRTRRWPALSACATRSSVLPSAFWCWPSSPPFSFPAASPVRSMIWCRR